MKADLEKNVPMAYLAPFDLVVLPVSLRVLFDQVLLVWFFFFKRSVLFLLISRIPLPFSLKSILVEDTCAYFQVTSKLGLTLKWNWADTLLV